LAVERDLDGLFLLLMIAVRKGNPRRAISTGIVPRVFAGGGDFFMEEREETL
jgi:hypothetical protein